MSRAAKRLSSSRRSEALFAALGNTLGLLKALLGGLVLFYLCSGLTRVGPDEVLVVFRFGKLLESTRGAGLAWVYPEPVDRVVRVATKKQHELHLNAWSPDEESEAEIRNTVVNSGKNVSEELIPKLPGQAITGSKTTKNKGFHPVYDGYTVTGDVNILQTRFTVRYRISDPLVWISAGTEGDIERMVEGAVYAAATRLIAGTKIDAILGEAQEKSTKQLVSEAQETLDALHAGITLSAVDFNLITPPRAASAAFAEVTNAQVEARTLVEQAQTYRAQVLPKAQADAYRIRTDAESDAQRQVLAAKASARGFEDLLLEYGRSPARISSRLRSEAVEELLSKAQVRALPGNPQFRLHLNQPAIRSTP